MSHLTVAPLLLPLFAGLALLLGARWPLAWQRAIGVAAALALVPLAFSLLVAVADGGYRVYALGDWAAPFGIVLVADRLSALMVALTAVLALFALIHAARGTDARGRYFHALFQIQLFGLNGAFLTGDLFNLFVFFEVLLIASYTLLLYGGGPARTRAGLHYVVLNLVGSSLFLIAAGILYGVTGTLNLADLAVKVAAVAPEDAALVRAGGLLLLVVFALKAALLPLHVWLPAAYAGAAAPVAALFAIMTKVGIYAVIRVYTLVFGEGAGALAGLAEAWLWPLALATLALGAVGALGSRSLRRLAAYLVVVSVGTLLAGLALGTPSGLAASLFYLFHTTLVTGGLFLLADVVGRRRGTAGDALVPNVPFVAPLVPGVLFVVAAAAVAGLPPLSGFLGKLLLLQAGLAADRAPWLFAVVLGAGFLTLVAVSRAGSVLFWRRTQGVPPGAGAEAGTAALIPAAALILASPLLAALAAPVAALAQATADQLADPGGYVSAVLGPDAWRVRP
ncbi:MAG: monovalent cation/H+ antiporter subunit D [Gammaproteobacteria bacterium]|nr:monovalent cation/H+ antiporter subunit D [Gammaproteobacteria bacterium]